VGTTHAPARHRCGEAHTPHTTPPLPQKFRLVPGRHSPVGSQQPVQVLRSQVGGQPVNTTITTARSTQSRISGSHSTPPKGAEPANETGAMLEPMRLGQAVVLLAVAVSGCTCDRRQGLTGRFGELVVVTTVDDVETLTREAQLTLPSAAMGESSSGTFLVRNVGDSQLTLTRLALAAGSPAFTAELPERTVLAPAEEVTFTVTFSPPQASDASLLSVPHQATLELEAVGGRPGETLAIIDLTARADARDCYVPAVLDFGDAPIGQAVQLPLVLSNATATPTKANLSDVSGPNPAFFTVDPPGPEVELPAGTPFAAQVRFAPTSELEAQAQLNVRRRASCPEGVTRLIGRGSMQALSWAPAEVRFGRVPLAETATRSVTFSNRSGAELPLSLAADGADFSTPTSALVLPARSTVTVAVSCRPSTLNALAGTLRVDVGTAPVLPLRVPLSCTGGGPRLRPTPSPLAFGNVPLLTDQGTSRPLPASSQTVIVRRLRLENVGTPPASLGDPTYNLVLGREGQAPLLSLSPLGTTGPTEFKVAVTRYDPSVGVPAVAGKNAIDLEVMLQPAAAGFREAMLSIYSNDAVQPVHEVRLTAHATAASRCTISATPTAVAFGDVPPNSLESQTVTITNTGTTPCTIAGLEIASGSHPGFSLGPQAQSSFIVGPGASVVVQVRFDSTGLATGDLAEGYLRYSPAGVTSPRLVPLSARVSQCIVIVPEEVDFGNIKLGCRSGPRAVQLFNVCGTPVRVTGLSTSGPGFGISAQPTIPATGLVVNGSSNAVTTGLVFQPPALGRFAGTFNVSTAAPSGTRTVTIPLTGLGDTTGTTVETFVQPVQPLVDILFTIDDSCSMDNEQAALAANFNAFISYANSANVDYRIAVVTTDDASPSRQGRFMTNGGVPTILERSMPNVQQAFASRVNVGTTGSGIERPLSATLKALTQPLLGGWNTGFLRDDANLAIIIVSDAPDQSPEPIDYYLNRLPLVKGARRVHQVSVSTIGPFSAPGPMCFIEGTDPGRYAALVTRTNGVRSDICTSNWANDLEVLGRSALGPRSSFFVRNPPDTQQPIDVQVNGQTVSNAWNYDPNANAIVFQPSQAPGAGTTLTITYQSVCL